MSRNPSDHCHDRKLPFPCRFPWGQLAPFLAEAAAQDNCAAPANYPEAEERGECCGLPEELPPLVEDCLQTVAMDASTMLQSCEVCNYYTGSSPADTDRQNACNLCTHRKEFDSDVALVLETACTQPKYAALCCIFSKLCLRSTPSVQRHCFILVPFYDLYTQY